MVVKMTKWSPWSATTTTITPTTTKKFQVKVKPIKLEGFDWVSEESVGKEKVVMVEMLWKGSKPSALPPLSRVSKQRASTMSKIIIDGCCDVEWEDEFECVCCFSIKDNLFNPSEVSFKLLYGQNGESRNKFLSMGTVSLNISELASQMECEIERKLPVVVQIGGVASEACLLISYNFIEIRVDSPEAIQDPSESDKEEGFFKRLTRYGGKKKKKKIEISEGEESSQDTISITISGDTDESTCFDSEGSPDSYNIGSTQQVPELKQDGSSIYYGDNNEKEHSELSRSETDTNQVQSSPKIGFWRKRRLSFRSSKKSISVGSCNNDSVWSTTNRNETSTGSSSSEHDFKQEASTGSWEEKELTSRDGYSKLKANVFFASIDQRSEKASGESACTALVTIFADWLHSYQCTMPTRSQFDGLIMEGSSEWRKLCENEAYLHRFPNKHFDLETVLEANLRPLNIVSNKSFIGFFSPEKFESLKDAMSLDGIWDDLTSNVDEGESRIYIVSWNDHFFVMKVEAGTYYIIDTLGERLLEGCNQAYILKFDDTSEIYKLPEKVASGTEETNGVETQDKDTNSSSNSEETKEAKELVCKGKECCLEFFKRFLAAIPLSECEAEQKKGTASHISLHQRLQIEFHYSSSHPPP